MRGSGWTPSRFNTATPHGFVPSEHALDLNYRMHASSLVIGVMSWISVPVETAYLHNCSRDSRWWTFRRMIAYSGGVRDGGLAPQTQIRVVSWRIYRSQSHDICWSPMLFRELHRKFYCQFSVRFRQRAEVPTASICYERNLCLHRIWTSIRLFLVRTRSAWIGSILSGTGESAHLFTYDGHGLSDKLLTNSGCKSRRADKEE
jgi:hypothetical protein